MKHILEQSFTATDVSVIITINLNCKFLFCSIKKVLKKTSPKIAQELSSVFPSYILFLLNVPLKHFLSLLTL